MLSTSQLVASVQAIPCEPFYIKIKPVDRRDRVLWFGSHVGETFRVVADAAADPGAWVVDTSAIASEMADGQTEAYVLKIYAERCDPPLHA